jgi:hypothetical protein
MRKRTSAVEADKNAKQEATRHLQTLRFRWGGQVDAE